MNKYNQIIHKVDIYDNLEILPLEMETNNIRPEVIEKTLNKIKNENPIIIEVGTWKGSSAIEMAKYFVGKGFKPTVFCVDTWNGSAFHRCNDFWQNQLKCKNGYPQIYYQFLSNIVHSNLQEYIVPIPLNSLDGARFIKELGVVADLCYIDACHEYDDVLKDIEFYYELVKNNCILFGDDYDYGWMGVVTAVNTFVFKNKLQARFGGVNSQWIIEKP